MLAQELLAGGEAAVEVPESFVEDVRQALYASKLVSYAQGWTCSPRQPTKESAGT